MKLHEIRTELELKSIQANIIRQMDNFGNHPQETFEFPKLPQSKSGLYKKDFSIIYTQLSKELPSFTVGYESLGSLRYLIHELPSEKYFFAQYLVTEKEISFSSIYLEASLIAFGIIVLILLEIT